MTDASETADPGRGVAKADRADSRAQAALRLSAEALVASIPYVGPAIQVAVFGRLAEIRAKRLERLVEELQDRLHTLGSDPSLLASVEQALETDERFMLFVRECMQRLTEDFEEEKFRAYKEAFLSGLTETSIPIDLKLEFLGVLRRVSTRDLHILGFLSGRDHGTFTSTQVIVNRFADSSPASRLLILSAIDTLADAQIIEVGKIGLDESGVLRRDHHEYRLTELGSLFADFLRLSAPPESNTPSAAT